MIIKKVKWFQNKQNCLTFFYCCFIVLCFTGCKKQKIHRKKSYITKNKFSDIVHKKLNSSDKSLVKPSLQDSFNQYEFADIPIHILASKKKYFSLNHGCRIEYQVIIDDYSEIINFYKDSMKQFSWKLERIFDQDSNNMYMIFSKKNKQCLINIYFKKTLLQKWLMLQDRIKIIIYC